MKTQEHSRHFFWEFYSLRTTGKNITAGNIVSRAMSQPERKKLRSCEPDLKITIGCGDTNKVIRWYHTAIIANHSGYVDAMLANPMAESQTNEISFPDISPETWDLMLESLEDSVKGRLMTLQDVMLVAKKYDKYDFIKGRELCSHVLVEYFKKIRENEARDPPAVDEIVDAIVLAHEANLEGKKEGMKYLVKKLCSVDVPYGRTMFTETHIKKISPLLLTNNEIFWGNWNYSKEDIKSPDFPRLFVQNCASWQVNRLLKEAIPSIKLSGTLCKADGEYDLELTSTDKYTCDYRTVKWGEDTVKFAIERRDNWVIVRETLTELDVNDELDLNEEEDDSDVTGIVCWECPCSGNLPLPPLHGKWKAIDPLARGNPKIKYIYRSNVPE